VSSGGKSSRLGGGTAFVLSHDFKALQSEIRAHKGSPRVIRPSSIEKTIQNPGNGRPGEVILVLVASEGSEVSEVGGGIEIIAGNEVFANPSAAAPQISLGSPARAYSQGDAGADWSSKIPRRGEQTTPGGRFPMALAINNPQ